MKEIENELWKKARKYLKFLQMVPFLRLVAVCNNLAFGTANYESDIDVFIVAKKNRLFFVRSFVTLLLHLLGVRRHGKKRVGRFCLSFFIDDTSLNLRHLALDDDFYLAYWVSTINVLIDDDCALQFSKANSWAQNYFEKPFTFPAMNLIPDSRGFKYIRSFLQYIFSERFGDYCEGLLRSWQISRARKKASFLSNKEGVLINDNILKFHNLDRRRYYNRLWFDKFGDMKLTKDRFIQLFP